MKDREGTTIEIDLGNDERIQILSTSLGEPEKALIVERALEIAAVSSRAGAPESADFEQAALELSDDAKVMSNGERVRVAAEADSPPATQVLNQDTGVHGD